MDKHTLMNLLVGKFSVLRLVRSTLIIYALFAVGIYFFGDRLIFQPPPSSYQDTDEILKIAAEDGQQLSALHLKNPEAKYTILYSHGNASDLGTIRFALEDIKQAGFSVFAYDYRGYGTNSGTPSEKGVYRDIEAAYDYLVDELALSPSQIIVQGQSVGGGPSAYLAAQEPVAGLILESSFTKIFRVLLPFPILPFEKFPNIDRLAKVNCPVLIIHGQTDHIIAFKHGQELFEAAPNPKQFFWVPEAHHNNVQAVAGASYRQALQDFSQIVEADLKTSE
ncbi:Multifunctional-autoprocessing repeats-in-toxin [Acaryochloris thomasi RCC1774]|uniref:Multifunctional-autoprocessing repeats-in-toxin n=1 Tax=Acaryochloris thomasi RCC1774 TaxID=1764569 RepID=A0A2W1JX06_9CYAN|nr:alpha/beta hydrolase [Acaryochloris thomasi]PZD74682.1 Multifunctional-autoprocessing repeats-in-toxin [Acaryochloris thomasi RCC1774]